MIIVFVLYEEGPSPGLLRFHRYRCPIYLNHIAFNQVGQHGENGIDDAGPGFVPVFLKIIRLVSLFLSDQEQVHGLLYEFG